MVVGTPALPPQKGAQLAGDLSFHPRPQAGRPHMNPNHAMARKSRIRHCRLRVLSPLQALLPRAPVAGLLI